MADLKRYENSVWDRFFTFAFPEDELATRQQVQSELQRLGLDVRKAVSRVQLALQAKEARADLEAARSKRAGLTEKIKNAIVPLAGGLRERLQGIIGQQLHGAAQAAYFRKLEHAATDDDLQSLLEDLHRLEQLDKDEDDGKPPNE